MAIVTSRIRNKVDALFTELGIGVQICVLDLDKVTDPVEDLLAAGCSDATARAVMLLLIGKYRQNSPRSAQEIQDDNR